MGSPFDTALAKIARGDEHRYALRRSIREWGEQGDAWETLIKPEPPGPPADRYRLYWRYLREPPDYTRLALVFGDAIHAYRSALDHLVYGLAVHCSRQDPPPGHTRLQCPITDTPGKWREQVKGNRLRGLSDAMRTEIKRAQPHDRWKAPYFNEMAALRDLDDADKHRLLHVAFAGQQDTSLTVFTPDWITRHMVVCIGPLEHDAYFGKLYFSYPVTFGLDMAVNGGGSAYIAIEIPGVGGYFEITSVLQMARNKVRRLVATMERFVR